LKRIGCRVAFLLALVLAAAPLQAETLKVFVSIPPQQAFVQKIGAERVDVSVLVEPGADPHTYEPKPRQMIALSKAALFFAIGVDFEKAWLARIAAANPGLRIVHTESGIARVPIAGDHHGAAGPDPHIWLAPGLVAVQARTIRDALVAVDPAAGARYEENCAAFLREIAALDSELKALFAGRQGAQFMVVHPSWGYFARAYGLEQVPLEIEGKDPKPAELAELIRHARQRGIKAVFVQPQVSEKSAELVAREIGGEVVLADPLAANWADNLRTVARKFAAALR
jgi:zinc transport system substrate-binding protein